MTIITLTDDPRRRNRFFQQTVLHNLHYWQGWAEARLPDMAAFDREQERIVRAITFGLALDEAWAIALSLISRFSPLMERRGYWQVWQRLLTQSLEMVRQRQDGAGEVGLLGLLARLQYQRSQFAASVRSYRGVLRLARHQGDQFSLARACSNLGFYFAERGQGWRAEILCCRALALFEQLDSDHGRAHTENHLGFLYSWQPQRWSEAQQHFAQACAIWQAMDDQHGLMRGLLNLAALYIRMEQPRPALAQLETALAQAQASGDEVNIGSIYTNSGIAHRLNGALERAEASLKQAEQIFKQRSNLSKLAKVWNHLGLTYFQQGDSSNAVAYLKKARTAYRDLGNRVEEVEVLLDLTDIALAQGDRSEATSHLAAIDNLLGSDEKQAISYQPIRSRLEGYRRSLSEEHPQQATAD